MILNCIWFSTNLFSPPVITRLATILSLFLLMIASGIMCSVEPRLHTPLLFKITDGKSNTMLPYLSFIIYASPRSNFSYTYELFPDPHFLRLSELVNYWSSRWRIQLDLASFSLPVLWYWHLVYSLPFLT